MSLHRWRKKKLIVIHSYAFISTTVDKTLLGLTVSQKHTHTAVRPLSGTTRVGRYQKKHSPTHTHPDYPTPCRTPLDS